ncbi:MAG: MBL fold metallo-hydrolase [Armatimonadetes bacterium]|nr:MBL fold metallo-hydrolase [Armatimonadota bacterium]
MMNKLQLAACVTLLFSAFLVLPVQAADANWQLTWHGQACFTIVTPDGVRILIDPPDPSVGFPGPAGSFDVVLISHEHFDHNYTAGLPKGQRVIRGLTDGGKHVSQVNISVKGTQITTVPSFHDKNKGKDRGLNTIFVVQSKGKRLVHLGDLGHTLTPSGALGKVDILLIPVGGFYTIDATEAKEVVDALKPGAVIPMHYKTPKSSVKELSPPDKFESLMAGRIVKVSTNSIPIDEKKLKEGTKAYLLSPP